MPNDERRTSGGAVAPDATPEERASAAAILASGPQPPPTPEQQAAASRATVERLKHMNAEMASGPPPEEIAQRMREAREAKQNGSAEVEEVVEPRMPAGQALSNLEFMLSSESPPILDEAEVDIKRLSRKRGCNCPANTHPVGNCQGTPFVVIARGLNEDTYREAGQKSLRQATREEQANGYEGLVTDVSLRSRLLVAFGVVDEHGNRFFESRDLRQRYRCDPEGIVQAWFSPGETDHIAGIITDLSGFSDGAVSRAKR